MARQDLKKLNRVELLQMMIEFSEEAERAIEHEKEIQDQYDREKAQLVEQQALERQELLERFDEEKAEMRRKFAEQKAAIQEQSDREKDQLRDEQLEERAALLEGFNQEKAEMRKKFTEQKIQMQEKFDKDIKGLRARLKREKEEMQDLVERELCAIGKAGTLAEASLALGGIFESAQKAADIYLGHVELRHGNFNDDEEEEKLYYDDLSYDIDYEDYDDPGSCGGMPYSREEIEEALKSEGAVPRTSPMEELMARNRARSQRQAPDSNVVSMSDRYMNGEPQADEQEGFLDEGLEETGTMTGQTDQGEGYGPQAGPMQGMDPAMMLNSYYNASYPQPMGYGYAPQYGMPVMPVQGYSQPQMAYGQMNYGYPVMQPQPYGYMPPGMMYPPPQPTGYMPPQPAGYMQPQMMQQMPYGYGYPGTVNPGTQQTGTQPQTAQAVRPAPQQANNNRAENSTDGSRDRQAGGSRPADNKTGYQRATRRA